jgi:hypothetical protein
MIFVLGLVLIYSGIWYFWSLDFISGEMSCICVSFFVYFGEICEIIVIPMLPTEIFFFWP